MRLLYINICKGKKKKIFHEDTPGTDRFGRAGMTRDWRRWRWRRVLLMPPLPSAYPRHHSAPHPCSQHHDHRHMSS